MSNYLNISGKIIIIFMLFYIVYKFIIPFYFQYRDNLKKRKTSINSLDKLIREKEITLRGNAKTINESKISSKKSDAILSLEELAIAYRDKQDQNNNDEYMYTEIIELFESAQWGSSQASKRIASRAKKMFKIIIKDSMIYSSIKKNYQLPCFQRMPEIKELSDFIIDWAILSSIVTKEESRILGDIISSKNSLIKSSHIIRGAHVLIIKNDLGDDFTEKIYKNILSHESPVFKKSKNSKYKSIRNTIFSLGENRIIDPKLLIDRLVNEAMIIMAITPIKTKTIPSKEESFKIFKILNNDNLDKKELNKVYKKYAQICHPDKIYGSKVPKDLQRVAKDNFIKIKNAYDLIKKETKK